MIDKFMKTVQASFRNMHRVVPMPSDFVGPYGLHLPLSLPAALIKGGLYLSGNIAASATRISYRAIRSVATLPLRMLSSKKYEENIPQEKEDVISKNEKSLKDKLDKNMQQAVQKDYGTPVAQPNIPSQSTPKGNNTIALLANQRNGRN